jgi:tetratricopeptide (TPR) repeat protein
MPEGVPALHRISLLKFPLRLLIFVQISLRLRYNWRYYMVRSWQLCTLSCFLATASARAQELPTPDAVKELKETLTQLDQELQRIQQLAKELSHDSKSPDKAAKTQLLSASIAKAGAISDIVTAQEAYRRGVVEEERLEYDQAVNAFTRAIQLDPQNDSALLHRGRMYFELGNFKLAVEDLTASLTIQPNNARAYDLRAQANSAQKSYDRAIADWREAALRDPPNALNYLLSQAKVEEDRGKLPQALEIYDQASRQNPGSAEVRLRRAAALKKQNRMEEAVQECAAAVELDSSDARGYVCRADGYVRLSRLPMAISDLDQAIRLNPMVPEAATLISAVWQRLELNAEAQQLSASAHPGSTPSPSPAPAVTPADAGAEKAKPAPVASTTNLSAPALAAPTDSLGIARQVRAYVATGREYTSQGRYVEAIETVTKAINLDPSLAVAYNSRGYAHLKSREYQLAIADFDAAIHLDSGYGNAYWNRGVARQLAGDAQRANDDLLRAATLLQQPH